MIDVQQGDAPVAETSEVAAEVEVKGESADDFDTKIDAAISRVEAKLEAKYKKQLEVATAAAKKEAQKLEQMSEDERQKAELENTRKELESKAQELKRKEIELEMTRVLSQRGVPLSFMNYFITDDNETTLENIKTFEKQYKAAIENAVNEKLKGKAPAASTNKPAGGSVSTLAELIKQNQARKR